jgi:hypothetical protein
VTRSVSEWLSLLQEHSDPIRTKLGFSEDMKVAHDLLFREDTTLFEKETVIGRWLQSNQPCMFGRIAAKTNRMHYCILTETDLRGSDESIKLKIEKELKLWKHRSLSGGPDSRHGFLLVVASPVIAQCSAEEPLMEFSKHVRSLWPLAITPDEEGNDVALEELYLLNPQDDCYYKFTFSVDFFAAAGDQRWWHDHRFPGGIAFSANSLGHMLRKMEWYDGRSDSTSWGLREAMHTISASNTHSSWGKATWLLDTVKDRPMKPIACPFAAGQALPKPLQGKDWTAYAGLLHTDHSIRNEFFTGNDEPTEKARPWFMDFTYIYDKEDEDFALFMGGQLISKNEIDSKIGNVSTRRRLSAFIGEPRTPAADAEIADILKMTESWMMRDEELTALTKV